MTTKWTSLLFIIVIVSDFYYKITQLYDFPNGHINVIVKSLVGVFMTYSMYKARAPIMGSSKLIGTFFICSLISLSIAPSEQFFYGIFLIGKYSFCALAFLYFLKSKVNSSKTLLTTIKAFVYINAAVIFLGLLFEVELFSTYNLYRFGFNGLLKSTSTATYFYLTIAAYSLFTLGINKQNTPFLLVIGFSSLMVGSKTLFISYFVLLTLALLRKFNPNGKGLLKNNWQTGILLFIIASGLAVFYINQNKTLNKVAINDGLVSAIFSYRNEAFVNAIYQVNEHFSVWHYFFGGLATGIKPPELGLIDLFLNLGVFGTMSFLAIFVVNFPRFQSFEGRAFFLLTLSIIFFRGNFFYYPSVAFLTFMLLKPLISSK